MLLLPWVSPAPSPSLGGLDKGGISPPWHCLVPLQGGGPKV